MLAVNISVGKLYRLNISQDCTFLILLMIKYNCIMNTKICLLIQVIKNTIFAEYIHDRDIIHRDKVLK